jgi:hypothetical protein
MTSHFISQMVSGGTSPPEVLIGTLSVVCIRRLSGARCDWA